MPNRVRLVLIGLSLTLIVALAFAPSASSQGDEVARIDAPANGANVLGAVEVRGRAITSDPARFSFYRLHYGAGSTPTSLRPIGSAGDQPVENGVLGTWDTAPLFQGEYTLQLTVYDTAGGTTTAHVVVNVLPAPTPTTRPSNFVVPVPGQTPTPGEEEDTGPTATPLPELPQLDPQIPNLDVPQQSPQFPPIQPVNPPPPGPGFQPIQIDPGSQPQQAPLAPLPGVSQPSAPTQFDPGPQSAPPPSAPFNPVNPVAPPPPPVVAPYEPPPTVAAPPTPTLFGLPP